MKINNIRELLDKVEETIKNKKPDDKNNLLFRGQPNEIGGKPTELQPKILRYKKDTKNIEKLVLTAFKRYSPSLIDIQPDNDFDWLTIAQHYGLPTRLLDWTYNPQTALWFSINSSTQNTDGALWIFSPDLADYQVQQNLDPLKSPTEIDKTIVYRPRNIISRATNQVSIFTIHQIDNNNIGIPLEADPNFGAKLQKFVVKRNLFPGILNELNQINTNSSTIFPDLSGLCQHLEWLYFKKT